MIIENHKKVIQIRLRALIMTVGCAVFIGFIFTSGWFNNDLLGLKKSQWAYGSLGLYILFSSYFFFLDYYYIYIFTDNSTLIIRYYSLRPLSKAKKTLKIPIKELVKVEIKKSAIGLKKRLVLYRKVNNKNAEYPPISLSALSNKEISNVKGLLRSLMGHHSK